MMNNEAHRKAFTCNGKGQPHYSPILFRNYVSDEDSVLERCETCGCVIRYVWPDEAPTDSTVRSDQCYQYTPEGWVKPEPPVPTIVRKFVEALGYVTDVPIYPGYKDK